jgi:succinate dehydrogenase / fumarate reductase, membrane anchor subunit
MTQSTLRTPLSRAKGLGSAKEGIGHFLQQRMTAVALIVLVPWFILSAMRAATAGYEGVIIWLENPLNAIGAALVVGIMCFHMHLGLRVVIEDYVTKTGSRLSLLALNVVVPLVLAATGIFAVLKISFGG